LKLVHSAAPPAPTAQAAENVLRRIEWTVLRRLDGALQGDYRMLIRGFGIDLADLREYQHEPSTGMPRPASGCPTCGSTTRTAR